VLEGQKDPEGEKLLHWAKPASNPNGTYKTSNANLVSRGRGIGGGGKGRGSKVMMFDHDYMDHKEI